MKRLFCFLMVLIMAVGCMGIFTACDTTLFEDEFGVIGSACALYTASADGRYLIHSTAYGSYIFDKTTNEFSRIVFDDDNLYMYHHITAWAFEEDALRVTVYYEQPQYDVNTGAYDYSQYYPVVYTFDTQGKQLSRDMSEEWLTEEEVDLSRAEDIPAEFAGIENIVSLSTSNSVYVDRYGESHPSELLNETEAAIYRYVFEKQGVSWDTPPDSPYYQFHVNAKRIGTKIWFSYSYCNKKSWGGQYGVWSGMRASGVCTYDEATGTFEDILSLGKQTCILSFTDETVLYYKDGYLRIHDLATGDTEKSVKLSETANYMVLDDRLFISADDNDSHYEEATEGTLTYTYIFDLSGNLLREN